MHDNQEILLLLEQLLKMSITGANYARDPYNTDRYNEIKSIAELLYSKIPGFENLHLQLFDKKDYVTPKIGVNAIIQNKKGELLLEKRVDDNCWGIPGGWAEVGLTAEENVIREVKEETGLDVIPSKILGVMSRMPTKKYLHTSYHIIFQCDIINGSLQKSYESIAIGWKKIKDIQHWHSDHREWLDRLKIPQKLQQAEIIE